MKIKNIWNHHPVVFWERNGPNGSVAELFCWNTSLLWNRSHHVSLQEIPGLLAQSLHVGLFLDPLLAYLLVSVPSILPLKSLTHWDVWRSFGGMCWSKSPTHKNASQFDVIFVQLGMWFSMKKMVHMFFSMVPPTKSCMMFHLPLFLFHKHDSQTAKHVPRNRWCESIFSSSHQEAGTILDLKKSNSSK